MGYESDAKVVSRAPNAIGVDEVPRGMFEVLAGTTRPDEALSRS